VKLFRTGSFTVLSLGDVEDQNISSFIRRSRFVKNEADVLILPHHGANNGFLSNAFLKSVRPGVAVCSANYNNKFEHPKPEVRGMLHGRKVPLYTTKTGDVIIQSCEPKHRQYEVFNLGANNAEIKGTLRRATKKGGFFARIGTDSYKNYVKGNKRF
jgi:competence protein ComEC